MDYIFDVNVNKAIPKEDNFIDHKSNVINKSCVAWIPLELINHGYRTKNI